MSDETARPRATLPAKWAKSARVYSAGYLSDTIMQCPRHRVNYVLRHSKSEAPTLLIYDCPVDGCLNTLQIPAK